MITTFMKQKKLFALRHRFYAGALDENNKMSAVMRKTILSSLSSFSCGKLKRIITKSTWSAWFNHRLYNKSTIHVSRFIIFLYGFGSLKQWICVWIFYEDNFSMKMKSFCIEITMRRSLWLRKLEFYFNVIYQNPLLLAVYVDSMEQLRSNWVKGPQPTLYLPSSFGVCRSQELTRNKQATLDSHATTTSTVKKSKEEEIFVLIRDFFYHMAFATMNSVTHQNCCP